MVTTSTLPDFLGPQDRGDLTTGRYPATPNAIRALTQVVEKIGTATHDSQERGSIWH